jgi:CubicO group peptidase (beta-lactamase class C family)
MQSTRRARVRSMARLAAIVVMGVGSAGLAGLATAADVTHDEGSSERQWVGVWTGVDDETDGRFHARSLVDFRIGHGIAGLEFQDLDRMRGASTPVKMTVQGEQFSVDYFGLWPTAIHVSGKLAAGGKSLEVTISGDGMTGLETRHATLFHEDGKARAFLAPRIGATGARVTSYRYRIPAPRQDGMAIASAKAEGIDTKPLVTMVDSILRETGRREDVQTEGVLIQRHGKLVFEEYFWGQSSDNPHVISSVTKSVTSILTGIAFDRGGAIQLDAPVTSYIADSQSTQWGQQGYPISVRNILSMSSGTAWDDNVPGANNPSAQLLETSDITRYVMGTVQIHPPGTFYNYDNGLPALMGILVARKMGEPFDRFAEANLFGPLGITNYRWTQVRGGGVLAAGGFYMLPRDMVKIGQLMLQDGLWNGRRVVSSAWVRESTRQQTAADQYPYGFYWHLTNSKQRHVQADDGFLGLGQGGQVIAVFPALDMVVVVTSQNWQIRGLRAMPFQLFDRYILPAIRGH